LKSRATLAALDVGEHFDNYSLHARGTELTQTQTQWRQQRGA
jgi:hypothetical protein